MPAAYATLSDLYALALPLNATGQVPVSTQQACLDARCEFADDKMRARYRLPLLGPYPSSLTLHVCILAAWDIVNVRGYNPAAGADTNLATRAEMALAWFNDVERQRAHPAVVESALVNGGEYDAPYVISSPRQGWNGGTEDGGMTYGPMSPSWSRRRWY